MGVERIVASSEKDYTEKSVDYIRNCIFEFQQNALGNFILGISGTNGHVRRARAADVFACLGREKVGREIDWARMRIFLIDERFGFDCEEEANSHLLRKSLVKALEDRGINFPETSLIMPNTSLPSWEQCATDYELRLRQLFETEGVDGPNLVTLGLGEDASIASIFPEWYKCPDKPERWLAASSKHIGVLCTETSSYECPRRIAVNLRVLRNSKAIVLYLGIRSRKIFEKTGYMVFDAEPMSLSARGRIITDMGEELVRTGSVTDMVPDSPLAYIMKYNHICAVQLDADTSNHSTFVVFGAAGDLSKKKTFPSVLQLHLRRVLPTSVSIVACDDPNYHKGIEDTDGFFENRLREYLQSDSHAPGLDITEFKEMMEFVPISFDNVESIRKLHRRIQELAQGKIDNRIFYLALPPFLFELAVKHIRECCWSENGSVRVVVEKPFGNDLQSARELTVKLSRYLEESQIFRIDHYLAKTMVLNILSLRFANRELGKLFHSDNVANVRITFKENIGVQGRAGYFDKYGIIRDVMQNHLLQLLTLVAMEAPATLKPEDVRDEKVKVLKQIRPVDISECVVGQYDGYQDDPDIQRVNERNGFKSKCPTFATTILYLDNERWSGVPFILKAGKSMETSSTIVRLQFKKAPPNSLFGDQPQNELVIRVQPKETIYYKVLAKTPGLTSKANEVRRTKLDLDVKQTFDSDRLPGAYEKLIYDVIQGESHNFVRADEVEQGWRIFDPLLKSLEESHTPPLVYPQGSRGPPSADHLINSLGYRRYTSTGVEGFAGDDFD